MSGTSTSRRSRSARRRARTGPVRRWGLFSVGLVSLLAASWWATNSPLFRMKELRVVGNHQLSKAEIARIGGLSSATNVLWMSTGSVERRLEGHPWIREARIARTPPSLVEVSVVERTPTVVVLPGKVLVADDGMVLGRATDAQAAGLPHVAAPGPTHQPGQTVPSIPQLVAARAMPGDLLSVIETIESGPNGTVTVRTRTGVDVLFGDESDAAAKWTALVGILDWATRNQVQADYIDVRSPIAPALKPVLGASGG